MRYHKLNKHYIKDTKTGHKITLTEACQLLNKYDEQVNTNKKFEVLK